MLPLSSTRMMIFHRASARRCRLRNSGRRMTSRRCVLSQVSKLRRIVPIASKLRAERCCERRRAREAVQLQAERTRAILDSVLVGIVTVGDGGNSNLVKSLQGVAPFGSDLEPAPDGARIMRMPAYLDPVSDEDIDRVVAWIDAGCPET